MYTYIYVYTYIYTYMYVCMAECCTAEINTALWINYASIKFKNIYKYFIIIIDQLLKC